MILNKTLNLKTCLLVACLGLAACDRQPRHLKYADISTLRINSQSYLGHDVVTDGYLKLHSLEPKLYALYPNQETFLIRSDLSVVYIHENTDAIIRDCTGGYVTITGTFHKTDIGIYAITPISMHYEFEVPKIEVINDTGLIYIGSTQTEPELVNFSCLQSKE